MGRHKFVGLGALLAAVIIGSVVVIGPFIDNISLNDNVFGFPDFYTKTDDYYITRIGPVPEIDGNGYKLQVTGCIDNPTNYSLSELRALPLIELPLTIECIGNPTTGPLLSTAKWRGFNVYNLLSTLGLESNATGVKYYAADGYYATHTLEQLMNNTVIGALYINNEVLPPIQGFPLRIINPGYYGAKQPAWVIGIEVIDMPLADYWDDRGWDTSPPMAVDSKIFFPEDLEIVENGDSILIGGAAYGGTRISKVEYTSNDGLDWYQAEIFKSVDLDNIWVFWRINFTTTEMGIVKVSVKATDIFNNTQPKLDTFRLNGDNSWPSVYINVI